MTAGPDVCVEQWEDDAQCAGLATHTNPNTVGASIEQCLNNWQDSGLNIKQQTCSCTDSSAITITGNAGLTGGLCADCPTAEPSVSPSASPTAPCAAGKHGAGGSSCEACPEGWASDTGAAACSLCPGGWASSTAGAAQCQVCLAGYYSVDATSCEACPTGWAAADAGAASCKEEEEGSDVGMIVGIVIGALVVGGGVVFFIMKKKK